MKTVSRFPDGDLGEAAELGAVTDRSVRVWLRWPDAADVSLRLDVAGRRPVTATLPLSAERDWTGAVDLSLPGAASAEPFTVHAGNRTLRGTFAPSPGDHAAFTFAFGSCHYPFAVDETGKVRLRRATRIYPALRDDLLSADARFLLLVGDQLYADSVPPISVRDELPGDADNPPPLDSLVAAYRKITRGFFAERGFRALREAMPTLCIWDDHDIFNNWGSLKKETALDRRLFAAASRAFSEYQDARNPGGGNRVPPFDFVYRYGTAGFLVLDCRGARSFEEGKLFGRAQWSRFLDVLRSEEANDLQTLFVVTSVPVAHASRWLATFLEWLPGSYGDAVRDRWVASAFRESRDEFLDALFAWQDAVPRRQVCLLSGDIHEAEASTIRRRGQPGTIRQFTSSAFTSPPSTRLHRFNWMATRFPNLLETRFQFDRRFLLPRNNAGIIRLEPRPDGGHHIRFTVRAWDPRRHQLFTAKTVSASPGDG
jgi:hypothetical protein